MYATTHVDGQSPRRASRTIPFATRVTPEFDQRIREIAAESGLSLVEVLEMALAALEESRLQEREELDTGDDEVQLNIRVSRATRKKLQRLAHDQNTTVQELMTRVINSILAGN